MKYYSGSGQTSIHSLHPESASSSSGVSSTALFALPQAGYIFSNRFSDVYKTGPDFISVPDPLYIK